MLLVPAAGGGELRAADEATLSVAAESWAEGESGGFLRERIYHNCTTP
ncbi:hypothetical protein [Haloferax marisrubri]|nr:hypothetical protein [Haloferax marisrubri]